MTNREWLNQLSNDDLVKWLFENEFWRSEGDTIIFDQPSPRLTTLAQYSTNTKWYLLQWLDEERKCGTKQ